MRWPRSAERNKELWKGPVPLSTIAQVHTHTDQADPKPAGKDVALAKQIGIPVYTVSRSGIWVAKPDGTVHQLSGPVWYKTMEQE